MTTQDNHRRIDTDRRKAADRRAYGHDKRMGVMAADLTDQKTQFFLRFAFSILGILYFNFIVGAAPIHWTVGQINIALVVYIAIDGILFWHCTQRPYDPRRYRGAMWADIAIVSIVVLNDPNPIPPTLLIYILIVLGNGMRYGMQMFAEGMAGCVIAGSLVIGARYLLNSQVITVGLIFFILFCVTILVYTYVLLGRIDASRIELERSSKYDSLTGLYNRRALLDSSEFMFQRLKRHPHKFVMLFADLDGFKAINDKHGHTEGDRALRAFADIIQNSIRNIDIAARFGGDEFVILLDDTGMEEAEFIATRIQKQLVLWALDHGMEFSVTFGIGEAPTHGRTFETLLEQVDKALYHSKTTDKKGGRAHAIPPVLAVSST